MDKGTVYNPIEKFAYSINGTKMTLDGGYYNSHFELEWAERK